MAALLKLALDCPAKSVTYKANVIHLNQQRDQKNNLKSYDVNSLRPMTASTCRTAASSCRLLMDSESNDEQTSVKKALKRTHSENAIFIIYDPW